MLERLRRAVAALNPWSECAPSSVGHDDVVERWGPFTKFVIRGELGTPYLTRYYLLANRWFRVYLHRVHRSDDDRAVHDHPWRFVSLLLRGPGYEEVAPGGRSRKFWPWSANARLDPAEPHRLVLDPAAGRSQWTLVVAGRKVRDWGFHVVPSTLADPSALDDCTWSDRVVGAKWVHNLDYCALEFRDAPKE